MQILTTQTETVESYRTRRIGTTIKELIEDGEVIKVWKVMRRAGIRKEFKNDVQIEIDKFFKSA